MFNCMLTQHTHLPLSLECETLFHPKTAFRVLHTHRYTYLCEDIKSSPDLDPDQEQDPDLDLNLDPDLSPDPDQDLGSRPSPKPSP